MVLSVCPHGSAAAAWGSAPLMVGGDLCDAQELLQCLEKQPGVSREQHGMRGEGDGAWEEHRARERGKSPWKDPELLFPPLPPGQTPLKSQNLSGGTESLTLTKH